MLSEKIVVVTGGAGLLGRKFCIAIANQGGLVIVADNNIKNAELVASEIQSTGGKAEAKILNITNTTSVENLIDSLHTQYGHIDAVVNNAYPKNKNYGKKLEEVNYTDFCENLSMHLGGYFLVAQQFALYFSEHGGGNIVNLSLIFCSMAPRFEVYEGTSMTTPVEYAAIKSSINNLTRYFANYFKGDGVRCNALSPGGIFDNQPESFLNRYKSHCGLKGMLDAEDIAGSLIYLLSDASRFVTGQNLIVDDGYSL